MFKSKFIPSSTKRKSIKASVKKTRAALVAVIIAMTVLGSGLALIATAPAASASTGEGTAAEKRVVDARIRAFKQQHDCTNPVPQQYVTALNWYARACNPWGIFPDVKCRWFPAGTYTYPGHMCYQVGWPGY